ncbi:MAG: di-trans,poly-cis-decaprenylcistransferase [Alphaproteobacteria bacterium]|nr:di-trans,poly-cis-decaprenylcistransferase [Alphaproteobacteria bacterium]
MDGNRRWAKKRGLPAIAGHRQGAKTLEQVCRDAKRLGIEYLTLYAFSTENWQRSKEEVDALMGLLREYLKNDLKELQENNARIVFIGERGMLAEDIVAKMNDIEKQTAGNTDFTLCLAISYGARQEILNAVKSAAQKLKSGIISAEDIDERYFSGLLYTKDIPDPDMLVRTSGEQRISNYLLWQIAYSELCFLDVLWPDFGRKELEMVIENYQNRERRYGKK